MTSFNNGLKVNVIKGASAEAITSAAISCLSSKSIATEKATEASVSASSSSMQASIATAQAVISTTKASEASVSASSAEASASTASLKANEASSSASSALTSKMDAATSEENALSYKNSASVSAATATNKASEASDSVDVALAYQYGAESAYNSTLSLVNNLELPSVTHTVDTVDDFGTIPNGIYTVIVKDINRGGTFIYDATQSAVNNGGTVFDGWIRQYSGAVNVKWFGAKGDGVTDDTFSIQSAINSLNKNIVFPSGTYMIGSNGLTGVSNQIWIGEGKEKTIIKAKDVPTLDMIYIVSCIDFGIENISFDGNNKLVRGTGHFPTILPCIYILQSSRFYIRNCGFTGFYNCGILMNITSYGVIENNYVNRGTSASFINHGIAISGAIGSPSLQMTIRGNKLFYCQISTNCYDSIITENLVTGWGFSAGINTQGTTTISYNLIISNNICCNSNQANDISPYSPAGIENWAPNSTITGNISYGNFGDGIDNGAMNCTITGNVCYNNKGYGLYNLYYDSTANASNTIVSGNHFYDTRVGASRTQVAGYAEQAGGLTGIMFSNNLTHNNLNNNVFTSIQKKIGYENGIGGTVTQATSKSTSVTLNKPSGQITMNNASLAGGAVVQFNLFNSYINIGDVIIIQVEQSSSTVPLTYSLTASVTSGLAQIRLENASTATYSEAFKINFVVIKGALV